MEAGGFSCGYPKLRMRGGRVGTEALAGDDRLMAENLTFRLSSDDDDAAAIQRLAEIDAHDAPNGPALLAELDGEPVAAIGFVDGRTVADPHRATPSLLTLLRMRRLETRAIAFVFGA